MIAHKAGITDISKALWTKHSPFYVSSSRQEKSQFYKKGMIILERQDVCGAIMNIMEALERQGKSPKTLKTYETSFNSFKSYLLENKIEHVDEKCVSVKPSRT